MTYTVISHVAFGDAWSTTSHNLLIDNAAESFANSVDLQLVVRYSSSSLVGGGLPQSGMLNGKIVASVTSNNLTVAIKTMAGADPSPTSPVIVRIGNTLRAITSARSVTKNAGTNWMNLGAGDHATQDVDLFVYLGYNSTDGVVLGFSRIPYASVYGDFSATSTHELYAAISTITNAVSTDEYENIGRFNATLSAAASYNWSIPATAIVISRPTFETRRLTYSPIWTNLSVGNGTPYGRYIIKGRSVEFSIGVTWGTTTSISGSPSCTLPIGVSSGPGIFVPMAKAAYLDNGVQTYSGCGFPVYGNPSTIAPYWERTDGTYAVTGTITSTTPFTFGSTDTIELYGGYMLA